jgi:hypothetical protein
MGPLGKQAVQEWGMRVASVGPIGNETIRRISTVSNAHRSHNTLNTLDLRPQSDAKHTRIKLNVVKEIRPKKNRVILSSYHPGVHENRRARHWQLWITPTAFVRLRSSYYYQPNDQRREEQR